MNKIISATLFVLICATASAQQKVKRERLRDFFLAPSYGTEFFRLTGYDKGKNGYDISYSSNYSQRFGFDLIFQHTKNLGFSGGFYYSFKNFERTETCKECTIGYFYNSKFKTRFLDFTGGATYTFVNGRVDFGTYVNANFSVLLKSIEDRLTETGNEFHFDNTKNSNFMIFGIEPGLYFNYNLSYRFSFGLKTGYRVYLNKIINIENFKNSAFSIQPGLYYKF